MILYEEERSNKEQYIYHQNDINLNFPVHMHNSYEFVAVLEGEIEMTIADKPYVLKENDCTIILPKCAHSYKTKHYAKTYVCIFSIDYVLDFFQQTKSMLATSPIFKIENAAQTVEQFQHPQNTFALKSQLYAMLAQFYEATDFVEAPKENSYIYDVLEYVETHFLEDISLQTAANYLGYSYNYTSALFNQTFKISFSDFLNNCRISYAVGLLLNSKKTVSEIALLSGYDSLRAFNRNFKRIKGCTPTAFLKNFSKRVK